MAHDAPLSPLAPATTPEIAPLDGVRFAAGAANIRYAGRTDVMLAIMDEGAAVAGVFTKSKCPSAPVDWCRTKLKGGKAKALLVNSGNANAFTGKVGAEAVKRSAKIAAAATGASDRQIFIASTGVIGEPLDATKFEGVLETLAAEARPDGWQEAARAIMTTDTFPKATTRTALIDGTEVRLSGIAKGSGMIAPDMATMLCFVATDANIPAAALQHVLGKAIGPSFNSITVDSDTSTSDTVLLFATGRARHAKVPAAGGRLLAPFRAALAELLQDLALQVVRDGEGAQKLVRVEVSGAVSGKSARRVAFAIANSPLVKTAIAGEDANWGRIVMAVGKAGEPAERDLLSVAIGGVWMARQGTVVAGYDEAPVVAHMKGREIAIAVDLGLGKGAATVWTCDLTHGYIDINGSYRS